jgi:glycosyltransferase involved in cell wall biosynthesis
VPCSLRRVVLGLDASRLAGPRTGVGRYLEYLLDAWSAEPMPFEQVRLFSPAPIGDLAGDSRFSVHVEPSRQAGIWWQLSQLRPKAAEVDVLYAPYTIPPAYRGRSVVANLGILEGPNRVPGMRARARSWHFAHSARHADAVIVNSEASKADLVRHYRTEPSKVSVVWPGVDPCFRPPAAGEEELVEATVERLLGERADYLLFVGKLSSRRNVPALLEAFGQIAARHPRLRLLLAGPNSGNVPLERIAEDLGIADSVRHVNHVEHGDLALLYRGARAFVLPTVQESFPTTALEAMASGCPVVTGAYPAIRETDLEGSVVVLPDPGPRTLADAVRDVLEDDALRTDLRERGMRRAASFGWDQTARKTMELLEEVAAR